MSGYNFWKNYEKWKKGDGTGKKLEWQNNWLANAYCGDCRYCCGPQGEDKLFPMGLLDRQIDADTPKNFYLLDSHTAYLGARGCKALGERGCELSREKKPVACGLFPITLVNGRLYLYQQCPAVFFNPLAEFLDAAINAARFLADLSLEDLRRVSINLSVEILSRKYIDLHVKIFDEDGKNLSFE